MVFATFVKHEAHIFDKIIPEIRCCKAMRSFIEFIQRSEVFVEFNLREFKLLIAIASRTKFCEIISESIGSQTRL